MAACITISPPDQLKAFVERVERLEEEKKAIADDIRDVYAEAKGNGFDVKTLRVVVRLRKQDINERKRCLKPIWTIARLTIDLFWTV
jgi:uncharacterized protein (UPF0335 family)